MPLKTDDLAARQNTILPNRNRMLYHAFRIQSIGDVSYHFKCGSSCAEEHQMPPLIIESDATTSNILQTF